MSKKNKILEEIHPLSIIREVQKWPALYTKDGSERANMHLKRKIWTMIAKSLFEEWDSYSELEKLSKVTGLAKRWRNLRDTFKRQLDLDRKTKEGQMEQGKKKTYVYFKHMSFLLPHLQADKSDQEAPQTSKKQKRRYKRKTIRAGSPAETTPASPPSRNLPDDIDEDKHFLLSLVPSFKKMTDDEKLTAKVEILNVIRSVRARDFQSVQEHATCDARPYISVGGSVAKVKLEVPSSVGLVDGFIYESDNGSESLANSD